MKNKNSYKKLVLNGLLYGAASLVAAVFAVSIYAGIVNGWSGQGSILSLFNKIGLTDFDEARPDVGIEYVYLRKISNPVDDFNYYKYQATVVVRNYGERLVDGDVVISAGENQKNAFVRNTLNGLTLNKGQTFVFDDYEVLMDGKYNYGQYTFEVELKDQKERDSENNEQTVDIYEEPVKLESLEVESVEADGDIALIYSQSNGYEEKLSELNLEICLTKNTDLFSEKDLKYAEVDTGKEIFSYYKIKANKDLLLDDSFECEELVESSYDFEEDVDYVMYLRALKGEGEIGDGNEDGNTDFFATSNLIYVPIQKYINRAEFTKLFTEYAKLGIDDEGKIYFDDVGEEDWYSPYVQTMFNYGLLHDPKDFAFNAEESVSRAEILEPLLNYFDVDLKVAEGAPHFYDVPKDHGDYFFAEGLFASGKAKAFGIYLHPDKKLSSHFLKYMINEFMGS
ncbi:MAG: S-layer homology domain-containing protein [Candidatus Gracilibacteria bacterium]